MDRRELLALCGLAGLTGVSGCLGYRVVDEERVATQRVRLAELEAAVDAREAEIRALERENDRLRRIVDGPRINAVSLVSRWERAGDVVVRSADEASAGEPLTVAVSFTYPIGGTRTSRVEAGLTVELTDADGETVATEGREVRLFLDPDATLAELPVRFGEPGFSPGRYGATARVTDRVTGIEVEAETVAFRVR